MARLSVSGTCSVLACLALAALVTTPLAAQNAGAKSTICLAPTTAQMASGNAADASTAVRETFASYLTGPAAAPSVR